MIEVFVLDLVHPMSAWRCRPEKFDSGRTNGGSLSFPYHNTASPLCAEASGGLSVLGSVVLPPPNPDINANRFAAHGSRGR